MVSLGHNELTTVISNLWCKLGVTEVGSQYGWLSQMGDVYNAINVCLIARLLKVLNGMGVAKLVQV